MDRPSPELLHCPHCHARNFAIDTTCFVCKGPLAVFIGPRPKVRHVNLGSIMIGIAVVAVCLAPIQGSPMISVVLMLFLVPATVRAILIVESRKADGRPTKTLEKINIFVESVVIASLTFIAAGIAFVATCVPVGGLLTNFPTGVNWMAGTILANVSGFIAVAFVIYWLGKRLWPRKD